MDRVFSHRHGVFAPSGALLTPVTLIVIVFGEGSTLSPPFAVPPLSLTWNVKLAYPFPEAFAAGVYVTSFPLTIRGGHAVDERRSPRRSGG